MQYYNNKIMWIDFDTIHPIMTISKSRSWLNSLLSQKRYLDQLREMFFVSNSLKVLFTKRVLGIDLRLYNWDQEKTQRKQNFPLIQFSLFIYTWSFSVSINRQKDLILCIVYFVCDIYQ